MKSISLLVLLTLSLFVKDSRTNEQFVHELEGSWVYSHTTNVYGDSFIVKFKYYSLLRYNMEFINKKKITSKVYSNYFIKNYPYYNKGVINNPFKNLLLVSMDSLLKKEYMAILVSESNINLDSIINKRGGLSVAVFGNFYKENYAITRLTSDTLVFHDYTPNLTQIKDSLVNVYDFTKRAHPGKYDVSTLHYYVKVKN